VVNASTIRIEYYSFFTIHITWDRPNDNFNEINKYVLGFTSLPLFTIQPAIESHMFDISEPSINYTVSITACNGVDCGDVSETVQFTSITPGRFICLSVCLFVIPGVGPFVYSSFVLEYTY